MTGSSTAEPEPTRDALAAARPEGVWLRGVRFDAVTEAASVARVIDGLARGRGGWVVTSNLDHLRRAGRDAEFRRMVGAADLVVADGAPLVWAARLQGTPLPERVAGSALVWSVADAAAGAGRSLFLLGGDPGTAEAAAAVLTQKYPGLRVAGTHCPPVGFEDDPRAMEAMRAAVRDSAADVVYVALGSPKQERLIERLRAEGCLPDAWWMGVGISLSFICGRVRRAPRWMQRMGLEWAHRMAQEPGRLARRYLVDGIPFAAVLLGSSVWSRLKGSAGHASGMGVCGTAEPSEVSR
ncbi:MAG: WecB/TagA/CpsF family glycosyltransferase [Planctomycetota bacterium]